MGCSDSSTERETYSIKCIYWKKERSKINILSFHLRKLEKGEKLKFKMTRRKEIIQLEHQSVKLKLGKQ